jgi:hypothetical protein
MIGITVSLLIIFYKLIKYKLKIETNFRKTCDVLYETKRIFVSKL